MLTRYELRLPALGVARFFVNLVVSAMHKIFIRDMQEVLARRDDVDPVSGSRLSLPVAAPATPDRTRNAILAAYARRYR